MKKPLIIFVIASLVLGLLIFVPDAKAAPSNEPNQRAAPARHQSAVVSIADLKRPLDFPQY